METFVLSLIWLVLTLKLILEISDRIKHYMQKYEYKMIAKISQRVIQTRRVRFANQRRPQRRS